jgi:CheY-like chemotaxis protein
MKIEDEILLLEDDKVDIMTIKRALKQINVTSKLNVVGNGVEALEYLRNDKNPKPRIIILDLNMPRMNGIEFLRELKQDKKLKMIPVVVLTTSEEEQDKLSSFNLGAVGFIIKMIDYPGFVKQLKVLSSCWLSTN